MCEFCDLLELSDIQSFESISAETSSANSTSTLNLAPLSDSGETSTDQNITALSEMPKTLSDYDDYLASHPDLIIAFGYDLNSAKFHYEQFGIQENRIFDSFDESSYLASYPDLIVAFGYDLSLATRHYIEYGYFENRAKNLFNAELYLNSYDDLQLAFGNDITAATRHYIEFGYQEGRQILPNFDAAAYIASYGDLITAFGYDLEAGKQHYISYGYYEGRQISFEAEDYIASYEDLIIALGYDLEAGKRHYIEYGYYEGRTIYPFNPELYLNGYLDLQAAFGTDAQAAARHYIEFGYHEGRDTLPNFDVAAYIASYPDLMAAFGYDLEAGKRHYLEYGYYEGRQVTFEADDYLASHGDLIETYGYNLTAATEHFIKFGWLEQRSPDTFDEVAYLNKYPDLKQAFGDDLEAATRHYIEYGYYEGRESYTPPSSAISFQEVTEMAGLTYVGMSFGAAWGDFNNDNYMDLWVTNHYRDNQLFLNQQDGTFEDITDITFAQKPGGDFHGAAWADFDNDGDLDLFQTVGANSQRDEGRPNALFINENGVLRDEGAARGVDYPLGRGRGPVWFDYDNDGLLDVWIANLSRQDGEAPPTFFKQLSNHTFVNALDEIQVTTRQSDFAILSDITGDGKLDLITRGSDRRNGSRVNIYDMSSLPFTNVTGELLPGNYDAEDIVAGDFNNDLRMDLYLVRGSNKLLMNSDQGLIDNTEAAGLDNLGVYSTGAIVGDFNNDMLLDIYVLTGGKGRENTPNILYENQGGGKFIAVTNAAGAAGTSEGTADTVTVVDYDRDGFLDIFTTNGIDENGPFGPSQLFRNQGNSNNWIQIDLEGRVSNRDGIGAQVFVTAGGITQLREQSGGVHKFAQDSSMLHFGLGQNRIIDEILVKWPSGIEQTLTNVSVNNFLEITEPIA
jgi:hypothetical protein